MESAQHCSSLTPVYVLIACGPVLNEALKGLESPSAAQAEREQSSRDDMYHTQQHGCSRSLPQCHEENPEDKGIVKALLQNSLCKLSFSAWGTLSH